MRLIGIAGDSRLDERSAHDICDAVDERMLHAAARDVHNAVGAELEQPQLRRAEAPADGEACAMPKFERRAGYERRLRQAVAAGEIAQRLAHEGIDAGLTKARASGAGWAMRTVQQ
jgi:hypothetical protein